MNRTVKIKSIGLRLKNFVKEKTQGLDLRFKPTRYTY